MYLKRILTLDRGFVSEKMRDMCSRYILIYLIYKVYTSILIIFKIILLICYMQRIGQSTRQGGQASINLERFMEALHHSCTNLTYPALTGARKQSIQDVERLFSKEMETFMEQKGYLEEARYICVINNWRRACDERGLSSEERKQFNTDLLEYILDDLMPWHKHKDFSHLEVNR